VEQGSLEREDEDSEVEPEQEDEVGSAEVGRSPRNQMMKSLEELRQMAAARRGGVPVPLGRTWVNAEAKKAASYVGCGLEAMKVALNQLRELPGGFGMCGGGGVLQFFLRVGLSRAIVERGAVVGEDDPLLHALEVARKIAAGAMPTVTTASYRLMRVFAGSSDRRLRVIAGLMCEASDMWSGVARGDVSRVVERGGAGKKVAEIESGAKKKRKRAVRELVGSVTRSGGGGRPEEGGVERGTGEAGPERAGGEEEVRIRGSTGDGPVVDLVDRSEEDED